MKQKKRDSKNKNKKTTGRINEKNTIMTQKKNNNKISARKKNKGFQGWPKISRGGVDEWSYFLVSLLKLLLGVGLEAPVTHAARTLGRIPNVIMHLRLCTWTIFIT